MGKLSESIGRGLAAARPAVADVSIGAIYFSTDTLVLERSNGTIWESISVAGSVADNSISTAKIQNDAVTYEKIQNVTDVRLLGRAAGSAGDVQEITVSGLTLAAGALTGSAGNNDWTTVITKSADQDVVNSSTFVDDTELQLPVTANDVWFIQLLIIYSATDASRDFKWEVLCSAGTMSGIGAHDSLNGSDSPVNGSLGFAEVNNSTDVICGTVAAHGIRAFIAEFNLFFSATGTFKFRFAESGVGAGTEARCKAKSRLRALKVSP